MHLLRLIVIIVISMGSLAAHAQSLRDYQYQWARPFGVSNVIDYRGGKRTIDTLERKLYQAMRNNTAFDEEGNLAFYTNDCYIFDYANRPLHNDIVNDNDFADGQCDHPNSNYTGVQGSIIFPDNHRDHEYYYIHQRLDYWDEPIIDIAPDALLMTKVYCEHGGDCEVLVQNEIIFEDRLIAGYMTTMLHENGRDWWTIGHKQFTDQHYIILIDEDGPRITDTISMGPEMHYDVHGNGQAAFSPDGTMYAMFNDSTGLMLYDFDRATGQISNYRNVKTPTNYTFSGVAFSASSQFIYLSAASVLYQVDTWAENLQSSVTVIDNWDGTVDGGAATGFSQAALTPDCKILISSAANTSTLHVINHPDRQGAACDFVQRGIPLPQRTAEYSMPNFPHYRVDEAWPCDSTIVDGGIVSSVDPSPPLPVRQQELTLYPNPTVRFVTMEEATVGDYYQVYDQMGRLVQSGELGQRFIDVGEQPDGVYTVVLRQRGGSAAVGRFVKE